MSAARTPLQPVDTAAALAAWRAVAPAGEEEPAVEQFGDSAELADELLGLVLAGRKRATATLAAEFEGPLPRIGAHWVACDGRGAPRAVLRTTELRLGPVGSVDDAFAADEGEDDGTRASWLREHTRYWRRVLAARGQELAGDAEVVFERFEVVRRLP